MRAKVIIRPLVDRFWAKVRKTNGCWGWGGTTTKGYGHICVDGKMKYAHRVSWEIHNGPIGAGMHVLHKCDNPPCTNPKHLFLGTPKDNCADKVAKGRWAHGETSGKSKLTEAKAIEIRGRYKPGLGADMAAEFNVSVATIINVAHGHTWRHALPVSK